MISYTTERFRKAVDQLPRQIRRQARGAYKLFKGGNEIIWYWIGPHSDYDKLLSRL